MIIAFPRLLLSPCTDESGKYKIRHCFSKILHSLIDLLFSLADKILFVAHLQKFPLTRDV